MEPSDSKAATTISHDLSASKMADHVESRPTISSQGQTSSTGNDQAMAGQPQNGNDHEQQPQSNDVDDQQPRSDAAANSSPNHQAPPNQIANEPHCLEAQQQQLPSNDLNPPIPINGRQLNGPFDQPPEVEPHQPPLNRERRIARRYPTLYNAPHFHFVFGGQNWTFNDVNQKFPVIQRQWPPMIEREQQRLPIPELPPVPLIQRQRIGINECHLLLMNRRRSLAMFPPKPLPSNDLNPPIPMNRRQINGPFDQPFRLMPALPPLISRTEIEPGIFEEIYSHRATPYKMRTMFGVPRCMCQDLLNYNHGNDEMITVIMNTPNLSQRFSMTAYREAPFIDLFMAYRGLLRDPPNAVFVAGGKRLRPYDTPSDIGMNDRENIYVFVRLQFRRPNRKCPK